MCACVRGCVCVMTKHKNFAFWCFFVLWAFVIPRTSAALTVTSYNISKTHTVRPEGVFTISLRINVLNGPSNLTVLFSGDSGSTNEAFCRFFGGNDLPLVQISKVGSIYLFQGTFTAPPREGIMHPTWILNSSFATAWMFRTEIDVTCSDGIYCNGMERWVRGSCVSTPTSSRPCKAPSGDPCSSYECIESEKACGRMPLGGSLCTGACLPADCKAKCPNRAVCGDDGCGGICGEENACNTTAGEICVNYQCQVINLAGSCTSPEPLFSGYSEDEDTVVPLLGVSNYIIEGDSSVNTVDVAQPVCNALGVPEYVYGFIVPEEATQGMGFEIRMTCADGTIQCDTLLAVHDEDCQPFSLTAVDRLCSDDQTPPGGYSSRVDGKLPPGTYTLVATGFSTNSLGPYRLDIKFVPSCYPKCEGKLCGDDGCGGSCGSCTEIANSTCYFGRCQTFPCLPDCQGRQCGTDGCGGTCGNCKNPRVCDEREGSCVPVRACDSFLPICSGNSQANKFCGSDCEWHRLDDPSADLIPSNRDEVENSIIFKWAEFPESSCALAEGCVSGTGDRLLMSFDTFVHNVGTGDMIGDDIDKSPDHYVWASCHQHYHFENFAKFSIYAVDNETLLVPGGKLSYCMEDVDQYLYGSEILCDQQYDCLNQGIPRGRR